MTRANRIIYAFMNLSTSYVGVNFTNRGSTGTDFLYSKIYARYPLLFSVSEESLPHGYAPSCKLIDRITETLRELREMT